MLVSEVVFWFLLTENLMPLSVPLPRITRHRNVNASKYIARWKSISKAKSQRKYDTLFFFIYENVVFPTQADFFYFSVDFSMTILKFFLLINYSLWLFCLRMYSGFNYHGASLAVEYSLRTADEFPVVASPTTRNTSAVPASCFIIVKGKIYLRLN